MLLLGHRGYDAKYPPNTILAFKKAMEYGADGVELDVWATKDGRVVVSHDRNIRELAGLDEDFDIKEHTYEELMKYRVQGKEPFPLLSEVYEALPARAFVNVEIKDIDAAEGAYMVVREHGALRRSIFTSFDVKSLQKIRNLDPKARIGIIAGKKRQVLGLLTWAYRLHAEYINIPYQIKKAYRMGPTRAILKFYRIFGVKIGVWTPNSDEDMKGFEDLAEMVITDDIEGMLRYKTIDNRKKR